jgi:hypothetical protein
LDDDNTIDKDDGNLWRLTKPVRWLLLKKNWI